MKSVLFDKRMTSISALVDPGDRMVESLHRSSGKSGKLIDFV